MTITQVISPLPAAPDPATDTPAVFSQKAAASVLAQKGLPTELNAFATQANAMADKINSDATAAVNSAAAATSAASSALAVSGATAWASGTNYALNAVAISQVNFQAYRRKVAGSGTVDPANDSANWVLIVGNATNGAFVGVPLTGTVIDLSLGNYFIDTISGAKTYTIINCPSDCYAFVLDLTITSGSPAFPGTVKVTGNYPITMNAGKSQLLTFITKDRGVARWRMSVAPNFDL